MEGQVDTGAEGWKGKKGKGVEGKSKQKNIRENSEMLSYFLRNRH